MALNKKISLAIGLLLLTALFTLFNWFRLEYLALFPVGLLFVYLAKALDCELTPLRNLSELSGI